MARGVNKVILVGNLGADPETRYTANGAAVSNISLATSRQWKDKQSGENREQTEWHKVVFFRRLAEIVGEYCRKGSQIYVEGYLQTRKWQDQQGQDRYSTEIVANEMQLLGGRGGGGGTASFQGGGQQASGQASGQSSDQAGSGGQPPGPPPMDDFDDDIPF